MRLGHLGPAGTFTEEAARPVAATAGAELVPFPSVADTVAAVLDGAVDAALVPIENSLEGTVNATVDALSGEPRLRMGPAGLDQAPQVGNEPGAQRRRVVESLAVEGVENVRGDRFEHGEA